MKIKGVVLGVAGAFAVTGAQAADLPVAAAPEPVDYVRVCDAFGTGFFYIPGTETCLKISGYLRAEYDVGITQSDTASFGNLQYNDKDVNGYRFRARGNVRFDTRTNTEFGLLRTYIETNFQMDNANSSSVWLDKGYIQFGGLTAGQAQSMFDFFTGVGYNSIYEPAHSDTSTNLLAYTYAFGNGFSATLSLEDAGNRETALVDPTAPGTNYYGGQKYPDVVANVRVDQGWGSAQIMAAGHSVNVDTALASVGTGSKYGYAVGAGVTVNLPFLGAGDTFNLQGVFTQGAVKYASPQSYAVFNTGGGSTYTTQIPDAFVNPFSGEVELTTAWSVAAGIQHYFTPQIYAAIDASYLGSNVDLPTASKVDLNNYNVTGTIGYQPVAGLEFGAALEYVNISPSNNDLSGILKSENSLIGLLRIQRNF
ncbi:Porin subfamily protein [Pseudoxanthobacter soli DSM 19599]|uniref:Porin n=1 Tax=Pseudoxanthobacter soli DSM 19599 TaxID=1123029 RepID=A0A1M7ZQX9_9HYPH|nr:porin [Pseudoxanthobacter soli]SHO67056.1 Porin subfamily protein [Pseudoxanthobacter soli DSM 19599]